MDDLLILNYTVSPDDFTRAGEASSNVKRKLKQIGVPPDVVRRTAIAIYAIWALAPAWAFPI